MLGVRCPYPKYDIGFVPRLSALAISMPGLMLVNENLLARMADPDDNFVAMVCAHEVSHLWFGCHISSRWWDDLWLDEAMAMYVSCMAMAAAGMDDPWTAFCYREEPQAYEADALPGSEPVGGARNRVACRAARPDAAAKAEAWDLAFSELDVKMAEAAASGMWVPGQEELLAGYRDRYFSEALAVLDRRGLREMRRLARALYPVTLAGPATLAATGAAAERGDLSRGMRLALEEQEAIMRSMLAARSALRRGW